MKLTLFQHPIGDIPVPSISDEALIRQRALIAGARDVGAVTDNYTLLKAVAVARDIRTHVKAVEEAGKELRKPLRTFNTQVKECEDAYVAPLEAEQSRLENMAMQFQEQDRLRAEAEERRKMADAARLERERMQAAVEAERLAAAATTDADLDAAIKREAEAAAAQAAAAQAIAKQVAPAVRGVGLAVKREMRWRCTDISALYEARPHLCALEPKPSAIRATVTPAEDATEQDPDTSIPGLWVWYENVASAKTR